MNIEEVAFKDRAELANLNELDLLEIIEFLQNDRKQWINQFTQTHNDYVDLQQENKKQKEVIDKAINLIVKETKSMPVNGCTIRLKELLDILKGSDKQ